MEQIIILQVLIPFIAALLSLLSLSEKIASFIIKITAILNFSLSIFFLLNLKEPISYEIGGWPSHIGIEYKINSLNQFLIVYINFIFVVFNFFCDKLLKHQLIETKRYFLVYPLLLFVQTGLTGILSTNDFFNFYVFIEIISITTCTLLAQGSNRQSLIGGMIYLIYGTIAATFILIAIGFFFSATGSLNISDIASRLDYSHKYVSIGIVFLLTGMVAKVGLFPLNAWIVKAYNFSSSTLLTYIASATGIVYFYMFYKLVEILNIPYSFLQILKYCSLSAMLICAMLACTRKYVRKIIVYSACSQVGYKCLIISLHYPDIIYFLIPYMIGDSLIKFALFLSIHNVKKTNKVFSALTLITLSSNAAMPFTLGFNNKINLSMLLIYSENYIPFIIMVITSLFALKYNYDIFTKFFLTNKTETSEVISFRITCGLFIITLTSIIFMFYFKELINLF